MNGSIRPPKVVAIARVRNEADIVEPFVRHHCACFDKLIILDDGSTDNTLAMMHALRASGLPLVVLEEMAVGYDQSRYMTRLLAMAVHQFGADWVAPLDADEFIETEDGRPLSAVLSGCPAELLSLTWSNFAWLGDADRDAGLNPVLRFRRCLPARPGLQKVIVPARLVGDSTQLSQGNHGLMIEGRPVEAAPLDTVRLCHFPIRDPEQYAAKIAVGYLKYRALPGWAEDLGAHYLAPFRSLLAGGLPSIEARMKGDSLEYGLPGTTLPTRVPGLSDSPLEYRGGPLTLAPRCESALTSVLLIAETLAKEVASNAQRVRQLNEGFAALQARATVLEADFLATIEVLGRERSAAMLAAKHHLEELAASRDRALSLELELRTTRELHADHSEALDRDRADATRRAEQLAEDLALLERRASALELELLAARELAFAQAHRRVAAEARFGRIWNALSLRIFRSTTQLRVIRRSPLFDAAFYLSAYADVTAAGYDPARHYLLHGAAEGRNPGPRFRTNEYLARNPDVAAAGLNPLAHFEIYGRAEGRTP